MPAKVLKKIILLCSLMASSVFANSFTKIKSEPLKNLPVFCKSDKKDISQEDDFNKFYLQLISKQSTLKSKPKISKAFYEDTVFRVTQTVILKKLWLLLEEASQNKLLVSDHCHQIGVNRFPINSEGLFLNKTDMSHQKDIRLLEKSAIVCGAKSVKSLVPFISKDVLAETLYYLKDILGNNFQNATSLVCSNLKSAGETQIKEDMYENYSVENYSENALKNFSKWLSDIYSRDKATADAKKLSANIEQQIMNNFQNQTANRDKVVSLTKSEKNSLDLYTSDDFSDFNICLREDNCDAGQKKIVKDIESTLNKFRNGTTRLESQTETLFRGMTYLPDFILASLNAQASTPVTIDKAFLSTSGSFKIAKVFSEGEYGEKNGYIYIIKSKSCVGISNISNSPFEDEFLCPPGLRYLVKSKFPLLTKTVYVLEEVK